MRSSFKALLGAGVFLATGLMLASPVLAQKAVVAPADAFAQDRASILAMAGDFKVTFDLRETTSWRADYTPYVGKLQSGHESVRVAEDTGRHIVLQHLLVVKDGAKTIVVKHWRQDWTYEPTTVLAYQGKGHWASEPVPEPQRKGRWSQTVWQTDDSPRYGGWGQWTEEGGVRRWRSSWTWRPLARRDATRKPPYDRYLSINRHSPTPTGWIHWQDNLKMGPDATGKIVPFVQEAGLNTYVRDPGFDASAADAYWNATKEYWAAMRTAWDGVIARDHGVHVQEVATTGSAGAERLMDIAEDIQANKITTAAAIAQGQTVIAEVTR